MEIFPTFNVYDFGHEIWLNNFNDGSDDANLVSLGDAKLPEDSLEFLAILKKNGKYDSIMEILNGATAQELFSWIIWPNKFPIQMDGEDRQKNFKFLHDFIPCFIMYKNHWSGKQASVEIRNYVRANSVQKWQSARLKKCQACGLDLSDLFATNLTTNNILDKVPVTVCCPHCFKVNQYDVNF